MNGEVVVQKHTIGVFAFDKISPFHLSVPCVVFGENHPGMPEFELKVCGLQPGNLTTTAGFDVAVKYGLNDLADCDTIIIPSWHDPKIAPPAELIATLQAANERQVQLVGLCLGAYALAEAGLLTGKNATTHWAYVPDFARRFPNIKVDPNVLYVSEGNLMTSAGTAAGLDCCLELLRKKYGGQAANKVARRLVIPPHRQGGQAQYIEQPIPVTASDSRLSDLIPWVRAHLSEPHNLDSLAQRALMTRRTFTRHFHQLTGTTVIQWLLSERLTHSQHLLEATDLSIEHISERSGFGSPASFRHHFKVAFGISPLLWRQTFQG